MSQQPQFSPLERRVLTAIRDCRRDIASTLSADRVEVEQIASRLRLCGLIRRSFSGWRITLAGREAMGEE